jgi:hypothetical protein
MNLKVQYIEENHCRLIKVLPWYLPEETEENYKNPQDSFSPAEV